MAALHSADAVFCVLRSVSAFQSFNNCLQAVRLSASLGLVDEFVKCWTSRQFEQSAFSVCHDTLIAKINGLVNNSAVEGISNDVKFKCW